MVRPSLRAWPTRWAGSVIFSSSLKKIFAPRGGPLRPRPALPRQSSASGREIAEKGRLAGHIGLVFHIAVRFSRRVPTW
eukprot:scaffold8628_cov76-Phaeocystis_antarctica.AAC.3